MVNNTYRSTSWFSWNATSGWWEATFVVNNQFWPNGTYHVGDFYILDYAGNMGIYGTYLNDTYFARWNGTDYVLTSILVPTIQVLTIPSTITTPGSSTTTTLGSSTTTSTPGQSTSSTSTENAGNVTSSSTNNSTSTTPAPPITVVTPFASPMLVISALMISILGVRISRKRRSY